MALAKKMNCKAEMANRHLRTACGKKHEVVCIPDAVAAVIASLPCVAKKDVKEHLLKLNICKSTGPDN